MNATVFEWSEAVDFGETIGDLFVWQTLNFRGSTHLEVLNFQSRHLLVLCSFDWYKTPQGFSLWNRVSARLIQQTRSRYD